jgi:hypothetical protein
MTTAELKPCPFCGGEAIVEVIASVSGGTTFSVGCDSQEEACCPGYQLMTSWSRRSDATTAWNRRATEPPASPAEGVLAGAVSSADIEWAGLSCGCGGGWLVGHRSGCPTAEDPSAIQQERECQIAYKAGRASVAASPISAAEHAAVVADAPYSMQFILACRDAEIQGLRTRAETAEADLAKAREAIAEALKHAAYVPGDHPILPTKVAQAFDMLRALIPAPSGEGESR